MLNSAQIEFEMSKICTSMNGDFPFMGFYHSTSQQLYELSHDTKVLSTLFECLVREPIASFFRTNNYLVEEPAQQNCYPDFTVYQKGKESEKIAIDVKTTYYKKSDKKFSFTLGSYTSFIRSNEKKNILYPFKDYSKHYIMGFVYEREAINVTPQKYSMNEIYKLRPVIGSVDGFFQEKWKIASDKPGSGNTKNIGSISAVMYDFQNPKPIFKNEEEFIKYWRQYPLTSKDNSFSDIQSYRKCLCR